jgi:hypothetical protein
MLYCEVEWNDLPELGLRRYGPTVTQLPLEPGASRCILAWPDSDDSDSFPSVIVVRTGGVEEFFAWTTVYLPQLVPISAFVRVVDHHRWTTELSGERQVGTLNWPTCWLNGAIGIVHAEVIGRYRGEFPERREGLFPYTSTLSWAMLQTASAIQRESDLEETRNAWDEARGLLATDYPGYSKDVHEVWSYLITSFLQKPPDIPIVKFIGTEQARRANLFREMAPEYRELFAASQRGPIEERVGAFNDLVRDIAARSERISSAHALLMGYALSGVSGAGMTHAHLLGPRRTSDIRPLLWYGWFVGGVEPQTRQSIALSASGIRLARLLKDRTRTHVCDISVEELRVLKRLPTFDDALLGTRYPILVALRERVVAYVYPAHPSTQSRYPQGSQHSDVAPKQQELTLAAPLSAKKQKARRTRGNQWKKGQKLRTASRFEEWIGWKVRTDGTPGGKVQLRPATALEVRDVRDGEWIDVLVLEGEHTGECIRITDDRHLELATRIPREATGMRIDFEDMKQFPDRDAGFFYAAEVFDDAGRRYPVRLMIEGVATASFESQLKIEGPYSDVVKALYKEELEALVKQGRLAPENSQGTLNVVFLVDDRDSRQIRAGDIVVDDVVRKLEATARRLGKL